MSHSQDISTPNKSLCVPLRSEHICKVISSIPSHPLHLSHPTHLCLNETNNCFKRYLEPLLSSTSSSLPPLPYSSSPYPYSSSLPYPYSSSTFFPSPLPHLLPIPFPLPLSFLPLQAQRSCPHAILCHPCPHAIPHSMLIIDEICYSDTTNICEHKPHKTHTTIHTTHPHTQTHTLHNHTKHATQPHTPLTYTSNAPDEQLSAQMYAYI